MPRSANTFPLPRSIRTGRLLAAFVLLLLLLGPFRMVLLSLLQPRPDLLDFLGRRLGAALRLLLEGVQHVDDAGELDRVDGPVRAPVVVRDHLQHAGPAEALEGF